MAIPSNKFDVFRPELWSPRVSRFFRDKLSAANFFSDYSADAMNADVVHIPHFDELNSTAADIATTNGTVTAVNLGDTKTDLTVNAWKGAAAYITKFEEREIMKRPSVIDEYASYLGYRCAKNVETAILANASTFTASVGSSVLNIMSTNIEEAFGILASNNVPKEECRIFISPKNYWKGLMGIQKYYDASQFGRASLPQGWHDQLYGVGITLTNNLTNSAKVGLVNCIAHPSAIAFAMYGPDFQMLPSENLRKTLAADVMYGDVTLRPSSGVRLISTNQ
jgi:hypothetical protein